MQVNEHVAETGQLGAGGQGTTVCITVGVPVACACERIPNRRGADAPAQSSSTRSSRARS